MGNKECDEQKRVQEFSPESPIEDLCEFYRFNDAKEFNLLDITGCSITGCCTSDPTCYRECETYQNQRLE